MAATVLIISGHGAYSATGSPTASTTFATTETDITSLAVKFKTADNDTNDTLNPIMKPAAGTNYSYQKNLRAKTTVTPDGDISNLRFFGDGGSWGTGVTLRGHSKPVGNYDTPVATQITTDGGSALSDVQATFTSGSPLSLMSAATIISNPSTGYGTQDLVELQLEVGTTASRGTKGPRTLTYRFDET